MSSGATIRFPATTLNSADAFGRFHLDNRDLLDERYRREQALGSHDACLHLAGTCGACLRVTEFASQTVHGAATPDGRRMPNWREQQTCGCDWALSCRKRALIHYALPQLGGGGWCRVGMLGDDHGLAGTLAARGVDATIWPRMDAGSGGIGVRLPVADGRFSLVLCPDQLHCMPQLDLALGELARVLMVGGVLLFTVPFSVTTRFTRSELARLPGRPGPMPSLVAEPMHQIGWDILDRVCAAGFEDCTAHCYWSEELGYLGSFNMIFAASR